MNGLSPGTNRLLFYRIAKILDIAEMVTEGVEIYLNVVNGEKKKTRKKRKKKALRNCLQLQNCFNLNSSKCISA